MANGVGSSVSSVGSGMMAASPFTPWLIGGGAVLGAIGGIMEAGEARRAEERRQQAMKAANDAYEARLAPIRASMEYQAAQNISGRLSPQDIALRSQYLAAQEGTAAQRAAAEQERISRSFGGFGEQYSPRALRAQQEAGAASTQSAYENRLKYALSQRADVEARKAHGFAQYGTLADMEAQRARMAMGLAEQTPTTTSGWGAGLGQLGSTAMAFGGQMYANQQQREALDRMYPQNTLGYSSTSATPIGSPAPQLSLSQGYQTATGTPMSQATAPGTLSYRSPVTDQYRYNSPQGMAIQPAPSEMMQISQPFTERVRVSMGPSYSVPEVRSVY